MFLYFRITLIGIFLFTCLSCTKVERVCTLKPEQAPEVRGFKLGMHYEDVVRRFGSNCNLVENFFGDEQKMQEESVKSLISLRKYFINIHNLQYHKRILDKNFDLKGKDTECYGKDNFGIIYNPTKFTELSDVGSISLAFDENKRISSISIDYEGKVGSTSQSKIKGSLNLSEWTNWEVEEKDYSKEIHLSEPVFSTQSRHQLTCENLRIVSSVDVWKSNDEYSVKLSINSLTNEQMASYRRAKLEEQQRKLEQEQRGREWEQKRVVEKQEEEKRKQEEEQRKNEGFKP